MKFCLVLSGVHQELGEVFQQEGFSGAQCDAATACTNKWVSSDGDGYIMIEFDTDNGTATVIQPDSSR